MKERVYEEWYTMGFIQELQIDEALKRLELENKKIDLLVESNQPWRGYNELMNCLVLFSVTAKKYPRSRNKIITHLSRWIQQIKQTLDSMVKKIGGDGYSISVSLPTGVSISVSFKIK